MFKRVGYRKIPTRIDVRGNVELGKTFIGYARNELLKLERRMQLGNVELSQLTSTTSPVDGVVIQMWCSFNLSQILITAEGGVSRPEKPLCKACMCGCHITTGVIAVTEPAACLDHITDLQFTYDVIVCQNRTTYIELTDCQPLDFTRYSDGEMVYILWVPTAPDTYAGNLTDVGCAMEVSSWGRILSTIPTNNKFDEVPCNG